MIALYVIVGILVGIGISVLMKSLSQKKNSSLDDMEEYERHKRSCRLDQYGNLVNSSDDVRAYERHLENCGGTTQRHFQSNQPGNRAPKQKQAKSPYGCLVKILIFIFILSFLTRACGMVEPWINDFLTSEEVTIELGEEIGW